MTILPKKKLRESGLFISFGIVCLFVLIPFFLHGRFSFFPVLIATTIATLSFASPYKLRKPIDIWLRIGNSLGKVNSSLILAIFFYLILVPASFGRYFVKVIRIKKQKYTNSYYIRVSSKDNPSNLSDQY